MNEKLFKDRTNKFAFVVIHLVEELKRTQAMVVIARQLLRSATSVGANYRAACPGKSTADVLAR